VTDLRKARDLAPGNAFTRLNLGTALYQTGDPRGALEEFETAVRLSPRLAKAHYAIGVLKAVDGRAPDAIDAFAAAIKAEPGYVEARLALADALRDAGRTEESLPHYAAVITTNPGVSQASFGRAMALVRLHRYQDARDRLKEATLTFPTQPGFAHALARLLAAAPDDRVRDGRQAMVMMRALLGTQPQTLGLTETMAMTLAEVGEFETAVQWQQQAVDAARRTGRADLVMTLTTNLGLYQRRQPCRTPWTDDDPVHHPRPSAGT
jgi:tetratricopeptide (TPR) repeat protein